MECPFCNTENRIDRETCYHCGKDISMLRLISNKARHHYNLALEHAERHRYYEAIAELQNALDLDSGLVEARVVLGTVYARLNRPEEAREQWENALVTGKAYQKAYTYLRQLRQTRPFRGVLRRLRLVLAGFALSVVAAVALLAALLWPNVPARQLDRAWKSYQNNNLAAAKARLDELSRPLSDTALEISAQSLDQTLERDFQDAMSGVERLRRQDHPYQARDRARAFLDRQPPQHARQAVEQLIREIRTDQVASIRRRIADAGDSPTRLDQAQAALDRFLDAFPDAPERDALAGDYLRAEEHYITERLAEVRQTFFASRDHASALLSLRALQSELEDSLTAKAADGRSSSLRAQIQAETDRIARMEFDSLLAQARRSLADSELSRAAAAANRAAALPLHDELQRAELDTLRADLEAKRKAWLLDQLAASIATRRWEDALAAADRVTTLSLDPDTRETVDKMIHLARRSRAVDAYHWLMRRADRIEAGQLDTDEIQQVARRARLVLDDLPLHLYPAALDDALFFLASAQRAAGRDDQARATLRRLRQECPKSRYLALLDQPPAPPRDSNS